MKVLNLSLNGKTYMTGKITAFLSKEALKIQKEALTIAKKGKGLAGEAQEQDIDGVFELLDALAELRDRKTWLITEVYQNQFTVDELEKALDDQEIDQELHKILFGIYGVIGKN